MPKPVPQPSLTQSINVYQYLFWTREKFSRGTATAKTPLATSVPSISRSDSPILMRNKHDKLRKAVNDKDA